MIRSERYKSLRTEIVRFMAEHGELDSVVETSYIATRLTEFSKEMDAILADAMAETVEQFSAVRDADLV